MQLYDILQDVDLYVENAIPEENKIRWLNQVQRQLFREYPLPDQTADIPLVPGTATYDLPADCPEDRIRTVTINGNEIVYAPFRENPKYGTYWTAKEGKITIGPTPTQNDKTLEIYYLPRPAELTSDNLSAIPDFPEDYHEVLSLGCAARVARAEGQYDAANALEKQSQALAFEAATRVKRYTGEKVYVARMWR